MQRMLHSVPAVCLSFSLAAAPVRAAVSDDIEAASAAAAERFDGIRPSGAPPMDLAAEVAPKAEEAVPYHREESFEERYLLRSQDDGFGKSVMKSAACLVAIPAAVVVGLAAGAAGGWQKAGLFGAIIGAVIGTVGFPLVCLVGFFTGGIPMR